MPTSRRRHCSGTYPSCSPRCTWTTSCPTPFGPPTGGTASRSVWHPLTAPWDWVGPACATTDGSSVPVEISLAMTTIGVPLGPHSPHRCSAHPPCPLPRIGPSRRRRGARNRTGRNPSRDGSVMIRPLRRSPDRGRSRLVHGSVARRVCSPNRAAGSRAARARTLQGRADRTGIPRDTAPRRLRRPQPRARCRFPARGTPLGQAREQRTSPLPNAPSSPYGR